MFLIIEGYKERMHIPTCTCGGTVFDNSFCGFGYCTGCGLLKNNMPYMQHEYSAAVPLMPQQVYTRRKRFKKYLHRASRNQSANTVPEETWRYLIAHGPYNNSRAILRVLKRSKLKRKCYDSLPIMTHSLCEGCACPLLSSDEQTAAMAIFDKIDRAVGEGPFISYVYALEYILRRMGRSDLLPFINTIQCSKRREKYKKQLDNIFRPDDSPEVSSFEQYGFCSTRHG